MPGKDTILAYDDEQKKKKKNVNFAQAGDFLFKRLIIMLHLTNKLIGARVWWISCF